MKVRNHEIGLDGGYVVAEAGTNHWAVRRSDRQNRAFALITRAAEVGADAIKFQIFVPDEPLFCPVEGDGQRWDRWKDTILNKAEWASLASYTHSKGLAFIGSAFQPGGVDIVQEVCDAHKVAVRANETYPWDMVVDKPAIVSLTRDGDWLYELPVGVDICRLYCIPKYPCSPENVDFWILSMLENYGLAGYSDHCPGPWMSVKALALGAAIVEKHFVLFDRDGDPDGSHAATPKELAVICQTRDAWR